MAAWHRVSSLGGAPFDYESDKWLMCGTGKLVSLDLPILDILQSLESRPPFISFFYHFKYFQS